MIDVTYCEAVALLGAQEKKLKKVNGVRFVHDGYEYRVKYEGGFAAFVSIERRPVGKKNFKYFAGVGAYDCWTVGEVMERVMRRVEK